MFLKVLSIANGTIASVYNVLLSLIDFRRLDKDKMVGIVTNGALSIIGVHIGLVTHLKTYNLHLVLIHYISHKEALLVAYVSKDFHQFKLVDKLVKNDLEMMVHFLCVRNKCMNYYINLFKFGDN
jgi:hypothetical protein